MASIGPQLPPHLTKRKRSPDDDAGADSPPGKLQRPTANNDEIDLESDSEDDYGPSAAPKPAKSHAPTGGASFGPSLPSTTNNNDEIQLDDSDDDAGPAPARQIGPTLTSPKDEPSPAASRTIGPSLPTPSAPRIHGPTAPPAPLSERPAHPPDSPSSDSDSDYGPSLPTAATAHRPIHLAFAPADPSMTLPAAPQRDDWMLAPPPASTSYREADPSKLRARKFATSRTGGAPAAPPPAGAAIASIWTETAAEKQKRLADAVLGRAADPVGPAGSSAAGAGSAGRDRAAEERDARIRANAEAARGKSLYEAHQEGSGRRDGGGRRGVEEEEDDPSKRAFDREKDMGLGTTVSQSQRRELITKAKDFGGRFQKGSYL